ncbi:Asp-tRNA(Asn)/Glu-tRNA(Gln) amidotransferase subunit GatB [Papillibacter cinnamivorans]|uniref:Aspartyl/glutamyl-tRNA(Asn/Gln) amidotransferase subunit B n=1 Tax=Papillibacter cinnamivorans DSM 12816 TaxID=1122930 RepID=A0A1W2CN73_9FIRM|nr:Asp-tRNA(Asn)/Glu-tRNA(Gln) amidotransferase subunit GatB [Papillibacter cinnamivorans]SMC86697.1 aspartyl/glutamyl-tRNA(Asn/Gln) amidotransferase subunit B [Papillibacter cinnamivorans DSM 12816]
MSWEMVCGLETHVELSTQTKIFCSCRVRFGGEPNTNCCPICVGHPGTLPKLNREVVRYAIMAGLVMNCEIRGDARMDRKNYVYPDLPKAYQISQYDKPLCEHGHVTLSSGREIGITRIHIEEDAGKLVHQGGNTFVDYNRGGVPLIEIVTEPDFRSASEIREYLEQLQLLMKSIGISDCKMQEGSLRCDVNLSVRPAGSKKLGTRAEIKNMNSFSFIEKAVDYEFHRQIDLIESGEKVVQETRRYNDGDNTTESMRSKEDAHDYRYFREPDLVAIVTTREEVEAIRALLPELPDTKLARYISSFGLSDADARLLVRYPKICEYFEAAARGLKNPKAVSNFILGQIFRTLETEEDKEAARISVSAEHLRELCSMMEAQGLRLNLAKAALDKMLETGEPAARFITKEDLEGVDEDALLAICRAAVEANPKVVSDYLGGKEKAVKSLIGQVMRETRGKADAVLAEELLIRCMREKA